MAVGVGVAVGVAVGAGVTFFAGTDATRARKSTARADVQRSNASVNSEPCRWGGGVGCRMDRYAVPFRRVWTRISTCRFRSGAYLLLHSFRRGQSSDTNRNFGGGYCMVHGTLETAAVHSRGNFLPLRPRRRLLLLLPLLPFLSLLLLPPLLLLFLPLPRRFFLRLLSPSSPEARGRQRSKR